MSETVLSVRELSVSFRAERRKQVTVVRNMAFDLRRGEVLCIVGESGCGKSVTASSLMGLLPRGLGKITGGSILYGGKDLARCSAREMRKIRGREIAMIFQDPLTSLNPVQRVSVQMTEMIRQTRGVPQGKALRLAEEALRSVGIPNPAERLQAYPFELSGGMIQRVMIAMALAAEPAVLIADEPTTALDVTIQAQVLSLIGDLKDRENMAVLLITHDMGVVAETADDVLVMYAGEMVEYGPVTRVLGEPLHPYTSGLLRALPRLDQDQETLHAIEGTVPPPTEMPGCRFAERCEKCMARCRSEKPPVVLTNGRQIRCHLYGTEEERKTDE